MCGGGSNRVRGSSGGRMRAVRRPVLLIKAPDGVSVPDAALPIGKRIQLRAVAPGGVAGAFQWRTRSRKVRLSNTNTATVTLDAAQLVSVRSGERVAVAFRSTDGSISAEASIQIKVIKVEFRAAPRQNYGYDNMDNAAGVYHHLSVKKNYRTTVQVRVTGGADGSILRFVSDNTSIATVTAPAGRRGANFTITVNGRNTNKGETSLKVRTYRDDGPFAALLKVNVYNRKQISAKVAKIVDSRRSGTALSRPRFSISGAQTSINSWYKACVGRGLFTDQSTTGGTVNVAYDTNGNGALDLEPGSNSADARAITSAFNPSGQKIVIVKNLNWIYFLAVAASIGDTRITLKSAYAANFMRFIVVGNSYDIGVGSNKETITVLSKTGSRVAITSTLTKNHPLTEGLMWPLSGLSGSPIWVQEGNKTVDKIKQTIAHECGHSLFNWKDVNAPTSLMHFSSGRTDTKLRYKDQPKKYNAGNENQWNKVNRT